MALITCPNCGEQISDKAKTCIHCGANLIPEEKQICQECGAEVEPGSDVCPKCGCPIKIEEAAQKVEVTGVQINKKSKNIILIVVIAVAAAIVIALAGVQVHKKNVAAAEAKAAEEQAKNYQSNLIEAYNNIISGASDTEDCGNLLLKVWRNSINKTADEETDKYTRPDGSYVSDFNDALQNLYNDTDFSAKVSSIKTNQDTVTSAMKTLQNPPEEFKDAYNAMITMYNKYVEFTNLITDPSGTYYSYQDNFNTIDSDMANAAKTTKLYLE